MREIKYSLGDTIIANYSADTLPIITEDASVKIIVSGYLGYPKLVLVARHENSEEIKQYALFNNECTLEPLQTIEGALILDLYAFDQNDNMVKSWILAPLKFINASVASASYLTLLPNMEMLSKLVDELVSRVEKLALENETQNKRIQELESIFDDPSVN